MKPMSRLICAAALIVPVSAQASTHSVFEMAPSDPSAITVKGVGDGIADDTAAIQAAIDAAANGGKGGVVFLPSGTYRISRTLVVRPAVRIFGIGKTRPVIRLADSTPGFGSGIAAMISFHGNDQYSSGKPPVPVRTNVPFDPSRYDASSNTFYSAMANVNISIGASNAGAVGVRFRVAQHGYLRHVNFDIESGLAGMYQVGNECEDLEFRGGRYGILTEKTSPAWQFTLIDSTFSGQRDAAIREHEVDLTLVNVAISDTPVGVEIDKGYSDSLWGKDLRLERVSKAGFLISEEESVFTQVGFTNVVANDTPVFARFRDSGRTIDSPAKIYRVADFSHGLKIPQIGQMGSFATDVSIAPLTRLPLRRTNAIAALPKVDQWANARDFGVKGDDETDDTAALQRAIDRNRVVYLPMGRYRVSNTIKLRPDSVLVALHPSMTHLYLPDNAPAYAGIGSAKALLESSSGGNAIVSGLGLWTGAINPRASALIWKAGAASMVNDVKIQGGGGTELTKGSPISPNDPRVRQDGQQPSIWVKDGGGGTFAAIWSPNTIASAGFYVTNTKTPSQVYELSAEHHYRHEIVLDRVENWEFHAPQTEQEVLDGPNAVSTEIRNSRNILFANYHGYRVTRTSKPMDTAIRISNSSDIRFRNVHINAESGYAICDPKGCGTFVRASKYPFENAIKDFTHGAEVREREFAKLDIGPLPPTASHVTAPTSAGVIKLADGFYSIAGATVDAGGTLYFVDRFFHRIHSYKPGDGLRTVADHTMDPVNLVAARDGSLMVLSSAGQDGTVYSIDPANPGDVTVISAKAAGAANASVALPVNVWENGEFNDRIDPATLIYPTMSEMFRAKLAQPKAQEYLSPDGSVALPAFRTWNQGKIEDPRSWRWSDTLNAHGLVTGKLGERIVMTNSSENRTYSGVIASNGRLTGLQVVAPRGGESVVQDKDGTLYVANGQIWVYDPDGNEKRRIDVPERPIQLILGGPDHRTLYILTHRSLYSLDLDKAWVKS